MPRQVETDPKELRFLRAQKMQEAAAIHKTAAAEQRELSRDESARLHIIVAECQIMMSDIEAIEAAERMQIDSARTIGKRVGIIEPASLADGMPGQYAVVPTGPTRDLSSFVGMSRREATDAAFRIGQWCMAQTGRAESVRWCTEHGVQGRTMVEGINAQGGATVPVEMEAAIINLGNLGGSARQLCRMWAMTRDTKQIPRKSGNYEAYFVGEGCEVTASDLAFDSVELNARKLAVLGKVSSELDEDSIISIANLVVQEIARAMNLKEDVCWIDGDGTSAYGGMVGFRTKMIDGNHNGSHFDATAHDVFTEFDAADLTRTMALLPAYVKSPIWICSSAFRGACLHRLAVAALGATAGDAVGLKLIEQFSGFPIHLCSSMPAGITTTYNGTVVCAFGDPSLACAFGDRREIRVRFDMSRYLEYDLIGVLATERFDIVVHDIGDDTNAGPLVGLVGNT